MARTTKKELIGIIFNILTANPEKEVCVVKYQNELRNGRWGMHAYTLCAMNNVLDGWVLYVRPRECNNKATIIWASTLT